MSDQMDQDPLKVLVIFTSQGESHFNEAARVLRESGVVITPVRADEPWQKRLDGQLSESHGILIILTKDLLKTALFYYVAGSARDRVEFVRVFNPLSLEIPPILRFFQEGQNYKELKSMSQDGLVHWRKFIREHRARKKLLDLGVPLNDEAFLRRIDEGELSAVQLFLEAGFDPNTTDAKGISTLTHAVRHDHRHIISVLTEAGADIDLPSGDRGNTPMMDAVAQGDLDMVRLFLDMGADPNAKSKSGQSALVLIASEGNTELGKMLLDHGADPDLTDALGMSARKYAALFKNQELLELMD